MFLLPNQQLERCDRVMQQRLKPHIHTTLSACSVRSFDNPGEPVPSDEFLAQVRAGEVDFQPFPIPGVWGTTWGTTWFEVSGRIDREAVKGRKIELMVDLGWLDYRGPGFQSEGLVYRADGTAIKSANPRNHWIPLVYEDGASTVDLDADGNFTVYIEAAANPFVEGPTPFSPTELGEKATGKREFPYTLSRMDVAAFNREAFAYYMDLETVSSLMRELKDDDPRYWQLAKALQRSLNAYEERDIAGTIGTAREELAGVLAEPAASSSINHIAIGHAHIDSAWLWPVRETRRKVARTVSNVLALMDEDPDFTYSMSSAQQYEWLEAEHPDLFRRMMDRVKEGRFIPVGGMWVESDNMIPSGESLIRQITFGKRYFRQHLGVNPRGIWLPDSFGYTGSWPQIARRAGFDWFLTQKISWNDTTKFPHHSFMWEGIDGTRILTHFPPSDTYCSSMSMHELQYSQRNFLDKDLSRNAILLYGFGDGGGGPTREMTARIRRDHDLAGAPKIEFGTPDRLFDRVRKDIVDDARGETPVFKGELYLELHRGTLTAQQDMKRGCREEESMLRVTEYLCTAAALKNPDYAYPREEMDRIWKTLLLNQFHDILPGSAIAWVHRQTRAEYAHDIARLRQIANEAGRAIAVVEPDDASVEHAVITPYARQACEAWAVRPAAEASNGSADGAQVTVMAEEGATVLDNGRLRVRVEADGTVSSLIDKARERELVPSGTRLGRYELLKDEPFHWDAWDIQRDAFLTADGLTDAEMERVEVAKDGSAVVHVVTHADNVEIRTSITLRPGSATLDFAADVDWHTQEQFLKVDIPVTVQAVNAQYECQYGMVERPINKNTRSDDAKFESCTHRFVRIADAGYAAAVVNASTYGSDVSPIHGDAAHGAGRGTMVRLSLLSAPLYPDPRTDQGEHSFAWSVVADAGMETVLAEANRINAPVLDELPAFAPLVRLADRQGAIVLDWIKPADDGSGDVIVRLYEAAGGNATASLQVADELSGAEVMEVSVMEDADLPSDLPRAFASDDPCPVDGAKLALQPFQLATLRIRR
ncbi:alpha-mannosidase [Bifidobacterium sp. UTCIF-3]|uniref:alpha-mannosidase n=1 Tax=unclassified Bifidobacterium TaxID=2608897 RepID=UPI0011278688|nr:MULTISPECIES: alpha-mannosidase [unclassified Bifidobacterium]TPF78398.1 alpha-mannosidase [Bifidobacterium sp. UTCIF-1]TPF81182.1 alpha-mannosidase [Bifidobacterium sp. UTCIF-24]TPF81962.1 alpha-mannosidase [Bifidobacterium sp. UTCIF-3]TPF85190.1 alpha-mannosidase [Bifidobacterium sp. UTCIF-36]